MFCQYKETGKGRYNINTKQGTGSIFDKCILFLFNANGTPELKKDKVNLIQVRDR